MTTKKTVKYFTLQVRVDSQLLAEPTGQPPHVEAGEQQLREHEQVRELSSKIPDYLIAR
jgi:hypothetical protein